MIGRVLKKRYEIYRELGGGGLSNVYLARDAQTGQTVAVKVLLSHMAADSESRTRFEREAGMLRSLNDSHFVKVFDYGQEGEQPFLVMEFIEGSTLKHVIIERIQLPPEQALSIARQVAEGLAALHRRGIIHRDIKPQNIMVKRDGSIKVMDFGIAKSANMITLTRTGFMLGTPHYISPEQAMGNKVDQRADIYSLGVVMYEMLTGQVPFSGKTPIAILMQHVNDPVPPDWVQRYCVFPPAAGLVNCCLAKKPDDRYETMKKLIAAIDKLARAQKWDLRVKEQTLQTQQSPGECQIDDLPGPSAPGADATLVAAGLGIKPLSKRKGVLGFIGKGKPQWQMDAVREFLVAALTEKALDKLCAAYFAPVYDGFNKDMDKEKKIDRLLSHCQRHNQLDRLVELVREQSPKQYAKFESRLKK